MSEDTKPEINWGYNCLTQDVHHGRPDQLWNIPLNYAIKLFSKDILKELVIGRIYNDAMQYVGRFEQKGTGETVTIDQAWADRVKQEAVKYYDRTLQHKVGEISLYYKEARFAEDMGDAARRNAEGILNWHYELLHPHDSINMLCRILGVSSSIKASG